jgi:hypothetical protein
LRWEIVWRKVPRICRDIGSALPFQTCLTQSKQILPVSNEHGSQVKDQGRRQCCHNKHKNFPIGLHVMYLYFPETSLIYQRFDYRRLKSAWSRSTLYMTTIRNITGQQWG